MSESICGYCTNPKYACDCEPVINIQAYICPVCRDDHSKDNYKYCRDNLRKENQNLQKKLELLKKKVDHLERLDNSIGLTRIVIEENLKEIDEQLSELEGE